jgi:hypothetical protein
MFEREDWTLFRNLGTLSQKAGVQKSRIRRLVLKELVDNSLDACGNCEIRKVDDDTYEVSDDGPGLPGDPKDVARLFSIRRPMTSSKLLRLPTRGALGNGLRVVAGAVLCAGQKIVVETRGRRMILVPRDDGSTAVESSKPSKQKGTRIKVDLSGLPSESGDGELFWAKQAITWAGTKPYGGRTNAWWYDSDSFYELLMAAGLMRTEALVAEFGYGPGLADMRGGILDLPSDCGNFDRVMAEELLGRMRAAHGPIAPEVLGGWGKKIMPAMSYHKEAGTLALRPTRGAHEARLPFVVEALAKTTDSPDDAFAMFYANGTPVTGHTEMQQDKADVLVFGCGFSTRFKGVCRKPIQLFVNVTIPYMPITTDGKEPDLKSFQTEIGACMRKAIGKAKRRTSSGDYIPSQRRIIEGCLDDAVAKASGGGEYRYSLRQLFYAVRPHVMEACEKEPDYNYFASVVTEIESSYGDLRGLYRDPRGVLYHPHLGQTIPLGTLAIEKYDRPEWTFNKILYSEKEGFFSILQSVNWPERHDCALLTSKGFASRAARDVLDLIGETGEEILFFCIHDADASGTMIYQTLQEATRARRRRKVRIVNLGLDPWEATEAGLQVESFARKKARLPVAAYVHERDDDMKWDDWLQANRVELNAMTTPEFLQWLDRKIKPYDNGKVIPPEDVLEKTLRQEASRAIRERVIARILSMANAEQAVATEVASNESKIREATAGMTELVRKELAGRPESQWLDPVQKAARGI